MMRKEMDNVRSIVKRLHQETEALLRSLVDSCPHDHGTLDRFASVELLVEALEDYSESERRHYGQDDDDAVHGVGGDVLRAFVPERKIRLSEGIPRARDGLVFKLTCRVPRSVRRC